MASRALLLLLLLTLTAAAQPLTLAQVRQRALQVSPTLRRFQARIDEARFKIDEAEVPGRPRVDFTARYTRLTPPLSFSLPGLSSPLSVIVTDNFSASVGLEQAIATFGRLHWGTLAAELSEKSAREELRREQELLEHRAALLYGRYLYAREVLQVASARVAAREAHLKNVELLFRSGKAARFDVLVAQTRLAEDRDGQELADQQLRLSRSQLLVLLDQPEGTELALEPLSEPAAPPTQDGLALALARRPELAALTWAVESARARVSFEESQSNPTLNFATRYEQRTPTDFSPDRQWMVGVVFSVPLYDGGLGEARTGQARSVVTQLEESLDELRRQVKLEVEQARLNLDSAWRRLEVSRVRVEQASEAARLAELRFRTGVATQVETLDAQTRLGEARLAQAESWEAYREALWDWERVVSRAPAPPQ